MWPKTTSARAPLWRPNCATDTRRGVWKQLLLLAEINVLRFDVPADAGYGGIRSMSDATGKPIRGNDLLIAARSYTTGATIVTVNTAEFKRIRV